MARYKLEVYDIDVENTIFRKVVEINNYNGFVFVEKLNGMGSATFSANIYNPTVNPGTLKRYRSQMLVKRDGAPIWLGTFDKFSGDAEGVDGQVTVNFLSYLAHLNNKKSIARFVRNQEYSDTAFELVAEAQARSNGTVLINEGQSETIGVVQETLEHKKLGDALIDASDNINGFYFNLTPILNADGDLDSVDLNILKNVGRVRDDLPKLIYGQNVQKIGFSTTDEIANYLEVVGGGTGEGVNENPIIVEDVPSQKAFTRIEKFVKFNEVSQQQKLQEKAEQLLNYLKVERYDINITLKSQSNIPFGSYNLGDYLVLDLYIPNTFVNFRGYGRVIENRIAIDANGNETITPKIQFIN